MVDAIPDFQNMSAEERVKLAANLRTRAGEHEKEAEAAQARIHQLAEAIRKAQEDSAKARAELDDHFDKSYYLRRMAHAVEMFSPPPTT